jgi:uncharacterized protein (DUF2235 family)
MPATTRLALFFDGSWCTRASPYSSNIARLYDAALAATTSAGPRDVPQRLFYDDGVGTKGVLERILGGALGYGLSENVREGYRFLSAQVQDPATTEIYLFGFSRGAFTARALAGFIGAAGLLRKEACTERRLEDAWAFYRTPPKQRSPARACELRRFGHADVSITMLGVFETVGRLGIPTLRNGHWVGGLDRFHDTKLGPHIRSAYHALGLDERREAFQPTLFTQPDHNHTNPIEQVWFPGEHGDVGGGARTVGEGIPISDVTLNWMMGRARAHGLRLQGPELATCRPLVPPTESPEGLWRLLGLPMERRVQARTQNQGTRLPGPRPIEPSWNERIHLSAFEHVIDTNGWDRTPALRAALPALRAGELQVVGHDGAEVPTADVIRLLGAPGVRHSPSVG